MRDEWCQCESKGVSFGWVFLRVSNPRDILHLQTIAIDERADTVFLGVVVI
jgi:hypothetical protein